MKKILTVSIGTISLLSACNKKDDSPSIDKSKLYGKWTEIIDVVKLPGQASDSTFYEANKPFLWDFEPDYFVVLGFPGAIPDTGKYTINGTMMSWLDSSGNTILKQNIDVLNDTLVLGQHSSQSDVLYILKRI